MSFRRYLKMVSAATLGFCLSLLIFNGLTVAGTTSPSSKTTRLTNPLLQYMKFRELRPFREKIEALLEHEKELGNVDDAAVYFRSLSDGIWTGINERKEFCPASLLKVPLMFAYYKAAEADSSVLETRLKYKITPVEGYTPGIVEKNKAVVGEDYTVDELIRIMITESNNNATEILMNNLPPGVLEKTFYDFGMDPAKLAADKGFASLKIVASFMRSLYNASYLSEEMSEKALEILTKTRFLEGLVAGVPRGTVVAHKFGERFFPEGNKKELHEVGIVYYERNPYILAVMTSGHDYKRMAGTIAKISKLVYEEVDLQFSQPQKNSTVDFER